MKMNHIGWLVAIALIAAAPASAQTAAPDCAILGKQVLAGEQEMSSLHFQHTIENSAPRAAVLQQQIANQIAVVSINLQLMQQAKCAPRVLPVRENAFLGNARMCELEYLDAQTKAIAQHVPLQNVNRPPSRDRSTWTRDMNP